MNLCAQDFSEKPKGDALEAMKVDTSVLGALHNQIWLAPAAKPSMHRMLAWQESHNESCPGPYCAVTACISPLCSKLCCACRQDHSACMC